MSDLAGKTVLITGSTRGIGRAIALRAARDGANVVITGKTARPHARLPETIHSTADAVERLGARALAIPLDVRDAGAIERAVAQAVQTFGGLDVLVNNAGAIHTSGTLATAPRQFDLMHAVNVRATYLASRTCVAHLVRAENPHILSLAPPLNLAPHWMGKHPPYTVSKYGMSILTLGMAEEFRPQRIAVNALWPVTLIATSAIRYVVGSEQTMAQCRVPDIVADAAHWILTQPSTACTGQLLTDEAVLARMGRHDLASYAVDPSQPLQTDIFIDQPE